LGGSDELAEAIADVKGGGNALEKNIARMRNHGRHARSHRLAFDQRRVSHADPGHVGDRVVLAGPENTGRYAEIAGALRR
jgi:hypothetical protein